MTRRDTIIQLICGAILIVCCTASGVLSTNIASEAGKSQLVYADRATEGDPPAVAYGVAMGAFRGLFVNYLWMRATRLKEEGKFHEAIQLSEAITTLQPRFPRVWAFHAWNMAYNISVSVPNADERYEWVKAGIDLLRDEALRYNPNDITIHKEIAWLYIHKIQGFMDDANRYYKRQLAREWTVVLGPPPELPDDTEGAKATMVAWLDEIVAAPNTLERVIEDERRDALEAMNIEDRERVEDLTTLPSTVQELVDAIDAAEGVALDESLLSLVAYYEAIQNSWFAQDNPEEFYGRLPSQPIVELLGDQAYADAWARLIPHVRKRVLVDTYKMQPQRMIQYTERYGPLDWRHPASHAIYWASKGVEESLERKTTTEKSYVNTDRIVVQCLQELWRSGTVYFDFLNRDSDYLALYNLHYTDAYGNVLEEIIRPRATTVDNTDRAYSLYSEGYENFLKEVIRLHYRLGNKELALEYKNKLAGSDWLNTNDPERLILYGEMSLDQFVAKQLEEERYDIPYVARTEITTALEDGYLRGLLRRDRRKWEAAYAYAKRVHDYFMSKQVVVTLSDRQEDRMQELPRDLDVIAATVYLRFITSGQMNPLNASLLWQSAPNDIKVRAYDGLATYVAQRGMPEDVFHELFPEPTGIEAWRAEMRRRESQNEQRDVIIERDS
ncbi:MAG: hypothetical protein Tsb0013_18090 [Phycisphaerales bacterium]